MINAYRQKMIEELRKKTGAAATKSEVRGAKLEMAKKEGKKIVKGASVGAVGSAVTKGAKVASKKLLQMKNRASKSSW